MAVITDETAETGLEVYSLTLHLERRDYLVERSVPRMERSGLLRSNQIPSDLFLCLLDPFLGSSASAYNFMQWSSLSFTKSRFRA